ncbi:MAG: 50S ribosomal protein L11 methyltransferase, partial [Verrucomicrobiota bacterium]|nr:50S ribosomal protein L11 methyltransferase [Verrucomicrobiota bacterium]
MQRKTTSSIRVADAGRSRRLCGVGLCEFKVQIPVAAVEATDAMLLELGLANWSLHEDAIAKEAWLIGIFADESAARKHWAELKPMLPTGPMAEPAARVLTDEDWRESYKAHFRPWRFGRLHWAPVWERKNYHVSPGEATLWLDPGLAFGTGNHETT